MATDRLKLLVSDPSAQQCGICRRGNAGQGSESSHGGFAKDRWVIHLEFELPYPFSSLGVIFLCGRCNAAWSEHIVAPAAIDADTIDVKCDTSDGRTWREALEIELLAEVRED